MRHRHGDGGAGFQRGGGVTAHEGNAYILGTDLEELHRLGLQHQVWSAEACQAWDNAGFSAGDALLDLGCGPGFCTQELAYIAGPQASVVGVDQSPGFIDFARRVDALFGLGIDYRESSFDDMQLAPKQFDGAWCRWALAWVPNPDEVIAKVAAALRPGASFAVHEYYDWGVFRTEPRTPALAEAIAAALASFRGSPGDIDVGCRLPGLFTAAGLEVVGVRPMSKLALPGTLTWEWPDRFFDNYLPRVVAAGLLGESTRRDAMHEWAGLAATPGASCLCPEMVEVVARKPVV